MLFLVRQLVLLKDFRLITVFIYLLFACFIFLLPILFVTMLLEMLLLEVKISTNIMHLCFMMPD